MIELYLIRHQESMMNKNPHSIGGRFDRAPSSELGIKQGRALGRRFCNEKIVFDKIYSSSARRTLETAGYCGLESGFTLDEVIVSDDLLELDQGEWEHRLRDEVYTPEVLAILDDNWNFKAPGGESQRDVEGRMHAYIVENIISRYAEGRFAIFTHGMAIKCFLRGVLDSSSNMTYKMIIDNTSITKVRHDDRGWHLVGVNDVTHLLGLNK